MRSFFKLGGIATPNDGRCKLGNGNEYLGTTMVSLWEIYFVIVRYLPVARELVTWKKS